ncbi:cupin domain-containing protein [Microbulbifer sp. DLAB2-AF]|uniref:cupin domain-containing protein n=1 Tax=Microbulbifer sp. DLAB2-AF TaxID=3243395 RepID=UPI004039593E
MNQVNFSGITSSHWKNIEAREVAPGIFERSLWREEAGSWVSVFEFLPGARYPGVETHIDGAEQIFVISGIFNDGRDDHPEGSFIHNPIGSAHIPQSETGCTVLLKFQAV